MNINIPRYITFQWHLNDQCNLRCKHCYQNSYTNAGFSKQKLMHILNQLINFVKNSQEIHGTARAHINFTGGEPFLYPDLLDILNEVKTTKLFTFSILSNGYLLKEKQLQQLKELKPRFIQLSLEGGEKMNDAIRGMGSYRAVLKALKVYRKMNIPVMLSFTANSSNYIEFPKVVKVARKYGAFKVWTDRYVPSDVNDPLILTTYQVQAYFNIIKHEQDKSKFFFFSKTRVSSNRGLQFLVSGGKPYRCSAGDSLLAILPNGDLLPCRRLPIVLGNLFNDDLIELYCRKELVAVRDTNLDSDCKLCYYKSACSGGLKCLSYAISNNYNLKDPNCWI